MKCACWGKYDYTCKSCRRDKTQATLIEVGICIVVIAVFAIYAYIFGPR